MNFYWIQTVTCLSIDPAASRLATGARDDFIKLWDFNGMHKEMKPFKAFEPYQGNPIRDVNFSNYGDRILVATTSSQAKLFDRDGKQIEEFVKGDSYIRDLRNTKGHVSALTSAKWHPLDRSLFITSSLDSTIRIWDVNNKKSQKSVIVVKSHMAVNRTTVTATNYSLDGKMIAGGILYL